MTRRVALVGSVLIAFGAGVFLWKAMVLALPVLPTDARGLWRIELEIDVRGTGGRGSVRAALPSNEPGQIVSDERLDSDRLFFTIRTQDGERMAVWSGPISRVHRLRHGFRVQISSVETPLPTGPLAKPPEDVEADWGRPSRGAPSNATEIADLLRLLRVNEDADPRGRLRTVFGFVADEVAEVESESKDALLTLAAREGSAEGKERLLVSLVRGSGIPARVVYGLQVREGREPRPAVWTEAWLGGQWISLSASLGFFGQRPDDLVSLYRGDREAVSGTQVDAVSHRYRAIREQLRAQEVSALMVPPSPLLAEISLFRLPVATQTALKVLLVIPLAALALALMRNVVGLSTFGTFVPILLALAMREASLLPGLSMVAIVLVVGVVARTLMDRLHLLLVPRVCILLCFVVLGIALFAVSGRTLQQGNLFGGVLLPIVILSMMIERFSVAMAEEGFRAAIVKLGWTTAIAVSVYPLFRSPLLQHLMFGFPELVFVVMGLLVFVGGYTGFRVTELFRFRALAASGVEEAP